MTKNLLAQVRSEIVCKQFKAISLGQNSMPLIPHRNLLPCRNSHAILDLRITTANRKMGHGLQRNIFYWVIEFELKGMCPDLDKARVTKQDIEKSFSYYSFV
jgi:hypothetical protein